jgi:hypothetical protein
METEEADPAANADLERDVATVRGAIALVASGVAVDIILCGLGAPAEAAERIAPESKAARVPVMVVPGGTSSDVVVGPREA